MLARLRHLVLGSFLANVLLHAVADGCRVGVHFVVDGSVGREVERGELVPEGVPGVMLHLIVRVGHCWVGLLRVCQEMLRWRTVGGVLRETWLCQQVLRLRVEGGQVRGNWLWQVTLQWGGVGFVAAVIRVSQAWLRLRAEAIVFIVMRLRLRVEAAILVGMRLRLTVVDVVVVASVIRMREGRLRLRAEGVVVLIWRWQEGLHFSAVGVIVDEMRGQLLVEGKRCGLRRMRFCSRRTVHSGRRAVAEMCCFLIARACWVLLARSHDE